MTEERWFKMIGISVALHFVVLGAFGINLGKGTKRIDLSSAYSVGLVGDIGGGGGGAGAQVKAPPETGKKAAPKVSAPAKPKKPAPYRPKPVPTRKEKEAVSISKKKAPPVKESPKESLTKAELSRLEERLREIKQRNDYIDVTRSVSAMGKSSGSGSGSPSGLPSTGEGGGRALDPAMQKYWMEVWDKVKAAWGLPGPAYRNMETLITIKIRKDGRIVDISMDKRSGSRVYDESIRRALRSV